MGNSPRRRRRPGKADDRPEGPETTRPGEEGHGPESAHPHAEHGVFMKIRGWVDALVIAYVLAMFIRTYVVELFKIPTGSMTPTLVGDDQTVEFDYDGDGDNDLALFFHGVLQVFLRDAGGYSQQIWVENVPPSVWRRLDEQARPRHDMILVNKFCYWFSPPKRGDIIVFKVPDRPELGQANPWNPKTPIFIKRCVGLPGDHIRLLPPNLEEVSPTNPAHMGTTFAGTELWIEAEPTFVNGLPLSEPDVFQRIDHFPFGFSPRNLRVFTEEHAVPADGYFMMGDNSANSTDSRAWGAVPRENIKGKAIFRYWPLKKISFLD